jgi:hypothetical protein
MNYKHILGLLAWLSMYTTGCITHEQSTPANTTPASAATEPAEKLTDITWAETNKTITGIEEGQRVEVVFKFTNTGKNPLIIKNVSASCGCTVPEKPEEPILPGKEGYIKGIFNSSGFPGTNHKTIYVDANTNGSTRHNLEFTVEVKPKKS